jgi:hypothetical protein
LLREAAAAVEEEEPARDLPAAARGLRAWAAQLSAAERRQVALAAARLQEGLEAARRDRTILQAMALPEQDIQA